jgi:hypothetical protein
VNEVLTTHYYAIEAARLGRLSPARFAKPALVDLAAEVERLENELRWTRTVVRTAFEACESLNGPCRAEDTKDGHDCGMLGECPFPCPDNHPWMRCKGE